MSFISYGKQFIDASDLEAVGQILSSDFLTQGPAVESFEKSVAGYVGADYAIAISNASAGLHLSCLALNVSQGDIVWTSPISFVASANCALYCGATVDFVDIDPKTYNLSIEHLREKLVHAEKSGVLPKAVIPVHFAGQSCDMQAIHTLSLKYGFKIIEDAAHAIGGKYDSNRVGSCQYSDLCVFSFHPVKIITTGEGGVVTTNNPELAEKLRMLRTHGITRDRKLLHDKSQGAWYYEQQQLGYNFRLTDMQAALGSSQLKKIENFLMVRRKIVNRYSELLGELPNVILPFVLPTIDSSWHLYVTQVPKHVRKQIFEYMREQNIGVNVHYIPIPIQPYYQELGYDVQNVPNALDYYLGAITLPLHPQLTDDELNYIAFHLKKSLELSSQKDSLAI